jgi:NifU-like protein involved in Fe-S cluster formation
MTEASLERLYSDQIKAYAQQGDQDGRLAEAPLSLLRRNPVCGSQVLFTAQPLDRWDSGAIALGCDARRACLLTQAATAVMVEGLQGLGLAAMWAKLAHGQGLLERLLANQAVDEGELAQWPQLAIFAPASAVRARHGSILLPFRTASEALSSLEPAAKP